MINTAKKTPMLLRTYWKLGIYSCFMVLVYRAKKKAGLYRKKNDSCDSITEGNRRQLYGDNPQLSHYFSCKINFNKIKWHEDFYSGGKLSAKEHWSNIDWFYMKDVDIKNVWELSRFYWYPQLAYKSRLSGNPHHTESLMQLYENWCYENPFGFGPNWMCGQECSIRLLNFILGQEILSDHAKVSEVEVFVKEHCKRIYLTTSYAKSQKNNHALSEGVGLYTGGMYLLQAGFDVNEATKYIKRGERLVTWCVNNLILDDGTFSQYSTNYHRLALDLLSTCFIAL